MALSIGTLTAWRDSLIESRMQGVRIVRDQNGEMVTYATDAEMARAIASADALIAQLQRTQPVTTIRFRTSKGL